MFLQVEMDIWNQPENVIEEPSSDYQKVVNGGIKSLETTVETSPIEETREVSVDMPFLCDPTLRKKPCSCDLTIVNSREINDAYANYESFFLQFIQNVHCFFYFRVKILELIRIEMKFQTL